MPLRSSLSWDRGRGETGGEYLSVEASGGLLTVLLGLLWRKEGVRVDAGALIECELDKLIIRVSRAKAQASEHD